MSKWIAEFELEDGDTMPEHMDLNYMGARIDFHCRPLEQEPKTDNIKALGEELRKVRGGITDEKALLGYNIAVAICNKYLSDSEVSE